MLHTYLFDPDTGSIETLQDMPVSGQVPVSVWTYLMIGCGRTENPQGAVHDTQSLDKNQSDYNIKPRC